MSFLAFKKSHHVSNQHLKTIMIFGTAISMICSANVFADCKEKLSHAFPELGPITFLKANEAYCDSLFEHAKAGSLPSYEGIYAVKVASITNIPGEDGILTKSSDVYVKVTDTIHGKSLPKLSPPKTTKQGQTAEGLGTVILMGELAEIQQETFSFDVFDKDATDQDDPLFANANQVLSHDGNWVVKTAKPSGEKVTFTVTWKKDHKKSSLVHLGVTDLGAALMTKSRSGSSAHAAADARLSKMNTLDDVLLSLSAKNRNLVPMMPYTNNPPHLLSLLKHAMRGTLLPGEHAVAVSIDSLSNVKGADGTFRKTSDLYAKLMNTKTGHEIGKLSEAKVTKQGDTSRNLGTFILFGSEDEIGDTTFDIQFYDRDVASSDDLLYDDAISLSGSSVFNLLKEGEKNGQKNGKTNSSHLLYWKGSHSKQSQAVLSYTDMRTFALETSEPVVSRNQTFPSKHPSSRPKVSLRFAIDLTGSNHVYHLHEQRKYSSAAKAIRRAISEFDDNGQIPVVGFGYSHQGRDHYDFDLAEFSSKSQKSKNAPFAQIDGSELDNVIQQALLKGDLSGPTLVAPAMRKLFLPEIDSEQSCDLSRPMAIAVVLTDGALDDAQKATHIALDHLDKPIGTLFVGIGPASFGVLEKLDMVGGAWPRDPFEFVRFEGPETQSDAAFLSAVEAKIAHIQDSYFDYCSQKK